MQFTIDDTKIRKAIERHPEELRQSALVFMRDSINAYKRTINSSPWRVGGNGGGVPIDSSNLKKAHRDELGVFESKIWVDNSKTQVGRWDYAQLVSGGTSRMQGRNWLKYAQQTNRDKVGRNAQKFLKNLVTNLAK